MVRDFANYKKHIEIALQKYDERQFTADFYRGLLGYQSESQRFMELVLPKAAGRQQTQAGGQTGRCLCRSGSDQGPLTAV